MIGRIGEVLRLQAERAAMLVNMAGFACDCAVEEIAGVELQPGLRRRDIERSAALRILELRGVTQPRVAIQDPVMVVALAVLDLLVIRVDARADRGRLAEVERRAVDGCELAGRNQPCIHRRVAIGVERQDMSEDVAAPFAGKIEVAVLRQVDRRRLVGRRVVVHRQLVLRP